MDFLKLFTLLLFFSSCAKVSYIAHQSMGQASLLWNSRDNEEVLNDPKVKEVHKEKIKKVIVYKKYFYNYFKKESTDIYSKTTILDQKAVTHLVIASPYYKVSPVKHWFPIVGSVPYLGFYKENSANEFAKDLEEEGLITYTRPVYAYSTLGYFEDRILSSFFYYSNEGLAELVFHELFHTVFFAESEVGLNEALANYFGKEMMIEYLKLSVEKKKQLKQNIENNRDINILIVKLSKDLNDIYKNEKVKGDIEKANKVFKNFYSEVFKPEIQKKCNELKTKCHQLDESWNNARLAAFGTYTNDLEKIEQLQKSKKLNLVQFLGFIEKEFQKYKDQSKIKTFKEFLLGT